MADRPGDHVVVADQVGLVLRLREGAGQRGGEVAATEGFSAMTRVLPIGPSRYADRESHFHGVVAGGGRRGRSAARRSTALVTADVAVIGGGYTGMWAAWELLERGRQRGPAGERDLRPRAERAQRRVLRVDVAVRAASARALRRRARPGAAGRVERDRVQDRRVVRGRGRRRLVRPVGLPVRLHGPGVRRGRPERGGRRRPRSARPSGWSRCREAEVAGALRLAALPGAACASPTSPPLQPARLALGLRRRLIERGAAGLRALARVRCSDRRPPVETAPAACRAGAVVLAVGPAARAQPRAALAADRHLLAHRADRARARRDRGARLDGRRVHHRRPHAGALLPHHPRRPHPARLGRRAAGLRLARERARGGRPATPRAQTHARAGAALPRRSRGGASRTPGAARSTSPPATSPRSARCPASPSTSASASRATAWARSNLVGRTLASLATGADDELTRLPLVGADAGAWVPPEPLDLAGRIGRARRARAPRAHPGGRPRPRPAHARGVRRAAGDRACTWRGRLADVGSFISRGFTRRRQVPEELADRVPPGQYVESGFPVLTAGPTPRVEHRRVEPEDRRDGRPAARVELGRSSTRSSRSTIPCDIHCVTKWSKLGTSFGGVSRRHAARGRRPARRIHDGPLLRGLHDQPRARRPDRRQGLGGDPATRASRSRASTAARRACWCRTSTSGRAPSGSPGCA